MGEEEQPLLHLKCWLQRSGPPGRIHALVEILIVPTVLCRVENLNV